MHKFRLIRIVLQSIFFVFVFTVCCFASAEEVTVNVSQKRIILNDVVYDNAKAKFPFVEYRDIVYFPLIPELENLCEIESHICEEYGALRIISLPHGNIEANDFSYSENSNENRIANIDNKKRFVINDVLPVSYNVNEDVPYPILTIGETEYFPLTYEYAVNRLDWEFLCSNDEMIINTANSFRPTYKDEYRYIYNYNYAVEFEVYRGSTQLAGYLDITTRSGEKRKYISDKSEFKNRYITKVAGSYVTLEDNIFRIYWRTGYSGSDIYYTEVNLDTLKSVSGKCTVEGVIPDITVSVGGEKYSNDTLKYPFLLINGTYYMPQTSEMLRYLGQDSVVSDTMHFVKSWVDYDDSPVQHELADEAHACEMNIVFDVVYCGDFYEINNASDYIKIPCKLMPVSYNDVRYIPITDDIFAKGLKTSVFFEDDCLYISCEKNLPVITVPEFPIILNGVAYDNLNAEYPFVMFNDIIYMPARQEILDFMGLDDYYHFSNFYQSYNNRFVISHRNIKTDVFDFTEKSTENNIAEQLLPMYGFEFYINREAVGGETIEMEYPPLASEDVRYFPLTSEVINELQWKFSYDAQNGLCIDSRGLFLPEWIFPRITTGIMSIANSPSGQAYYMSDDYYAGCISYLRTNLGNFEWKFVSRSGNITWLPSSVLYRSVHVNHYTDLLSSGEPKFNGNMCTLFMGEYEFFVNMDTAELVSVSKDGILLSDITVKKPGFDVTVNGITFDKDDSKIFVLLYNDIVYIPITEEFSELCGFDYISEDKDGKSHMRFTSRLPFVTERNYYLGHSYSPKENYIVYKDDINVGFCLGAQFEPLENFELDYPLLRMNDTVFLPLTYQIACEIFGWQLSYSENTGLAVDTRNNNRLTYDFEKEVYLISVKCEDTYILFYPDAVNFPSEITVYGSDSKKQVLDLKAVFDEYGTYEFEKYSDVHKPELNGDILRIYSYSEFFEFFGFLEINIKTLESQFVMEE